MDDSDVEAVPPDAMNLREVHVSDDSLGPVESDQPKSMPFAALADLLDVEPLEPPFLQSVGDPPG